MLVILLLLVLKTKISKYLRRWNGWSKTEAKKLLNTQLPNPNGTQSVITLLSCCQDKTRKYNISTQIQPTPTEYSSPIGGESAGGGK